MLFLSVTLGIPFHEVRQWPAAEILLYQVYYRISPWGEDRADVRNAMQMAQTANMHRDSKTHPELFELSDFMPFSEKPEPESDPDEPAPEPPGLRELFTGLAKKKTP